MLLADTSVLIAQFRNFDPKREALIRGQPVGLCGPVLAEFLAGARTVKHQAACQVILASLIPVATPEAVWELAGRNQALLATNGLNVPLVDAIIASVAIVAGLELWAYDAHFLAMAALLTGLQMFREP